MESNKKEKRKVVEVRESNSGKRHNVKDSATELMPLSLTNDVDVSCATKGKPRAVLLTGILRRSKFNQAGTSYNYAVGSNEQFSGNGFYLPETFRVLSSLRLMQ